MNDQRELAIKLRARLHSLATKAPEAPSAQSLIALALRTKRRRKRQRLVAASVVLALVVIGAFSMITLNSPTPNVSGSPISHHHPEHLHADEHALSSTQQLQTDITSNPPAPIIAPLNPKRSPVALAGEIKELFQARGVQSASINKEGSGALRFSLQSASTKQAFTQAELDALLAHCKEVAIDYRDTQLAISVNALR